MKSFIEEVEFYFNEFVKKYDEELEKNCNNFSFKEIWQCDKERERLLLEHYNKLIRITNGTDAKLISKKECLYTSFRIISYWENNFSQIFEKIIDEDKKIAEKINKL